MKKTFKTTDINGAINVEYDETKFDISIIESENRVIVRRLADGVILKSFTNIGFIVQTETEEVYNFVISEYYKTIENVIEVKLKHYKSYQYSETLELKNEFECESAWLEQVRILDDLYLVDPISLEGHTGGRLYNLKEKTKIFKRIFNDKNLLEFTNKEFVLVAEDVPSIGHSPYDLLMYGVDPSTYEIVTNIWSEEQQRFFSIYTDEEKEEIIKKSNRIKGYYEFSENHSNEYITKHFEVINYLAQLANKFCPSEGIYIGPYNNSINEPFLDKLTKTKK